MRRHIDLSTPVVENHFRWPVERKLLKSHEAGDHVQATWAGWIVHGFTHMDSPKHFVADGFTTDHITLDMTCGQGAVVDVSDVGANQPVTEEIIAKAGAHVEVGGNGGRGRGGFRVRRRRGLRIRRRGLRRGGRGGGILVDRTDHGADLDVAAFFGADRA